VERFILLNGGIHTALFWIGQVVIGGLVPMALSIYPATQGTHRALVTAALCVVLGGFAQVYVIIIGGQAYPLVLFPGLEVSGGFRDNGVTAYVPSAPEIALGLGGVAIALILVTVAIKVLPVLPTSLADAAVDPHRRPPVIKGKG
jgi:molybdopterin-containing oxidoreductase family membrane subunit